MADVESARTADAILHSHDQHAIAKMLEAPGVNTLNVIKEMEKQSKHLGGTLPEVVIDGLAEHLVHETKKGESISGEYNEVRPGTQQALVAKEFDNQKPRNITTVEGPNGAFVSVSVDLGNNSSRIVYEPEDGKHKLWDKVKKPLDR